MTTLATIKAHSASVTPEQIGRCHLILRADGNFYKVENSRGELDENGEIKEYTVRYSKSHGFTCDCLSGLHGFANVKHASGVCWHVRAAVACSMEVKAAMREQIRLNTQPVGMYTDQDSETVKRVMSSKGAPVKRGSTLPQSRPFQLMR